MYLGQCDYLAVALHTLMMGQGAVTDVSAEQQWAQWACHEDVKT
jgi:hypothetical protein